MVAEGSENGTVKRKDVLADPNRWKADVYLGWVPWRFTRWWAANKLFVLIFFVTSTFLSFVLTGAIGLIIMGVVFVVWFVTKFLRDRKRGIGFTKKNEIVVFGPHAPLAIPAKSIQALGVMKINRVLSFKMQQEDPEIMPDQQTPWRKLFGFLGYSSEAPIRAKDMAAAREMSLGSGKGLMVVVRDHEGVFWTVSTASGYEVAALRDLAALCKVKFITPSNPFGVTKPSGPKKNSKRGGRTKQWNRVLFSEQPDSEVLARYGVHELKSFARLNAFIQGNAVMRNGELPEEWIAKQGLHTPDTSEIFEAHKKVRAQVAVLAFFVTLTLIVAPLAIMRVYPVATGGLLTSSWPAPYERLWKAPPGWDLVGGMGETAEFALQENPSVIMRVAATEGRTEESFTTCEDLILDRVFFLYDEDSVPAEPPPILTRDSWEYADAGELGSVWCEKKPGKTDFTLYMLAEVPPEVSDPFSVVTAIETRINV